MVLKCPDDVTSQDLAAQVNGRYPRGVDVGEIQAEVVGY
jgi:hypothetical protein